MANNARFLDIDVGENRGGGRQGRAVGHVWRSQACPSTENVVTPYTTADQVFDIEATPDQVTLTVKDGLGLRNFQYRIPNISIPSSEVGYSVMDCAGNEVLTPPPTNDNAVLAFDTFDRDGTTITGINIKCENFKMPNALKQIVITNNSNYDLTQTNWASGFVVNNLFDPSVSVALCETTATETLGVFNWDNTVNNLSPSVVPTITYSDIVTSIRRVTFSLGGSYDISGIRAVFIDWNHVETGFITYSNQLRTTAAYNHELVTDDGAVIAFLSLIATGSIGSPPSLLPGVWTQTAPLMSKQC